MGKNNYVDNEKFFEAMVKYKAKIKDVKDAHAKDLKKWKSESKTPIRELRRNHPELFAQFLQEKEIRQKTGKWPRDIMLHYNIPLEPMYLQPQIPDYIGKCIFLIANGMSHYWQFNRYSWREDIAADAMEDCVRRIDSFKPEVSKNPFNYLSQICYFAAVRCVKKEKKQKIVKSEIIKNSGIIDNLQNTTQDRDEQSYYNGYIQFLMENEDKEDVVEEKKETAKKMKRTTLAYQKKLKEKEKAEKADKKRKTKKK